jgi:hypothetical protein
MSHLGTPLFKRQGDTSALLRELVAQALNEVARR